MDPRPPVSSDSDIPTAAFVPSDPPDTVTHSAPGSDTGGVALLPPELPDEIGRLGPYRVLGVLGYGGMGLVYRAEDPHLRREVALKVLLPRWSGDRLARLRFLREAQAQARVEHEHVVAIYQVGEENGVPFIAMPLLRGETLAAALERNPRPKLAELLRIGREIAEGLAAAHEAGLVHRDIKPANVWLEGDRRKVKVLDFGLARGGAEPTDQHTTTGAILGTPAYMSPEQARGESVDHRTDLFGLGAVLYQMATGRQPFTGANTLAILTAVTNHDPPSVRELAEDVPAGVSALIHSLLEKDADERPDSSADVAEELRRFELRLSTDDTVAEAPRRARKSARGVSPVVWIGAAVGLFLVTALAGVAIWWATREKPKAPDTAGPGAVDPGKSAPPKSNPPSKNPAPPARKEGDERKAAESIHPHCAIECRLNSGSVAEIWPNKALPTEPFTVVGIKTIWPSAPPNFLTAAFLPALAEFPALEHIGDGLRTLRWTEDDVARLADLPCRPNLRALVTGIDLTQRNLDTLKRFPKFRSIGFRAGRATPELLAQLPELGPFESLRLEDLARAEPLGPRAWANIAAAFTKYLSLTNAGKIDTAAARAVARRTELISLGVTFGELDEGCFHEFAKSPTLKTLNLGTCTFAPDGLKHLAAGKALTYLSVSGTKPFAPLLPALSELKNLRDLQIAYCDSTDEQRKQLAAALPACRIEWDGGEIKPKP